MKILLLCLGAACATVPPPILELIGDEGQLRYETGRIVQYTDNNGDKGVHIDSSVDIDGNTQANYCTKIDGKCVINEFQQLDQKVLAISDKLNNHQIHIDTHVPSNISEVETGLSTRITNIENAVNTKANKLKARADSLNTTQQEILSRLDAIELDVHNLGTTTTPPPTTTTTTTTPPGPEYGSEEWPGKSCLDILAYWTKYPNALPSNKQPASGKYWIQSTFRNRQGSTRLPVYCDMENDGGGWTLVQKGGTQGCFIDEVGELENPTQSSNAKLSDRQINQLMDGHLSVTRWNHGSPNWKDYANNAKNAAPAATKIYFRGQVMSTTSTKNRPWHCGSTPSGTNSKTFEEDPNGQVDNTWEIIPGYNGHLGWDTFEDYGGRFGESVIRNCGVVEQEWLNVDGVDNRKCAGNHFCKDPLNYGGETYKGLSTGYKGMGSYFIGCYSEFNKLPAETSGCRLGTKPGCMEEDTNSEDCSVKAQMQSGYCNGINWDAHAHGGCHDGNPQLDGSCRHCNDVSSLGGIGKCNTTVNSVTSFMWPKLETEGMTSWVRAEYLTPTRYATPLENGKPVCMDVTASTSASNNAAANKFCEGKGFDAAQAWGTHENADYTACQKLNGDAWVEDNTNFKTQLVNIECVTFPTNAEWKATWSEGDSLEEEDDAPGHHGWWGSAWR